MSNDKCLSQETISLLEKALNISLKDYEVVVDKNDAAHGNLGAVIFVSLMNKNNKKKFHLVIKQALCAETKKSADLMQNLYTHEIYFYNNIWSNLETFQKGFQGITSRLFPECYTFCRVPGKEVLVLENLKHAGFKVLPKDVVFDENHLKIALKTYGEFHGLSAAFREYNPKEYRKLTTEADKYIKNVFHEDIFDVFMSRCLQNTTNMISDEKIKVKMPKYVANFKEILTNSIKYEGRNSVILHGDSWSSNLMFKYDSNGIPRDVRILDFQIYFSGSVAMDISYLLYAGGSKDIYKNLDDYLKIYYNSFSEMLHSFKLDPSEIFTFADLKNEWKVHCVFGFLMGQLLWANKFSRNAIDIVESIEKHKMTENKGITFEHLADAFQMDKVKIKEYCLDVVEHLYENGYL